MVDYSTTSDAFDSCGYEEASTSIDTRNSKFQAKVHHTLQAASNKSYNYKDYHKMMLRREAIESREQARLAEAACMRQMKMENAKWQPVDAEDARHLQREAAKRAKEAQKATKKREKET